MHAMMLKGLFISLTLVAAGSATATDYFLDKVCSACAIDTPLPDAATAKALDDAYKDGWFHSVLTVGDTMAVCNQYWCGRYRYFAGYVWGDGVATKRESHSSPGKQCTPEPPPRGGSSGAGGGQSDPGGTVIVGPIGRPLGPRMLCH